jgi:lysophosphatidate acyltransferase
MRVCRVRLYLASALRIIAGLLLMAVLVPIALAFMIPLLPWRWTRLRIANRFGTLLGAPIMWISGCPMTVTGRERISSDQPVIYAGNHTSIYDTFLSIWLSPIGTVGVAKKQILYYPFFGVAWLLSGNLSIDRSNPERAIESMNALGDVVHKNRLSIFMWPEGRRSADGRLQPFKKGLAHLAIRTGLPIVPVVIAGAHRAWAKGRLILRPEPISVTFLPPISTAGWTEEHLDEHLDQVHAAFAAALPEDQQPLPLDMADGAEETLLRDVRERPAAHRDHRRSVDGDRASSDRR